MEDELTVIERNMLDLVTNNVDFALLRHAASDVDAYLSAYEVMQRYNSWLTAHASIGALYVASADNGIYRAVFRQKGYDYAVKQQMERYVRGLVESASYPANWFAAVFDGAEFLCRVLRAGGAYTVCMIDLSALRLPESGGAFSENARIVFHENGQPVTERAAVSADVILLGQETRQGYFITGEENRYLAVEARLGTSTLTAAMLVPYNGIFHTMSTAQAILFIFSLTTVLFIPLAYSLLYHTFTRPMSLLMQTIRKIEQGDMEAKVQPDFRSQEFNQVAEAFNRMMDQIILWKTSYFEKELAERQAHLQYLQMQIRPHFCLNCLKNLYAMIQEQKYKDTQETILQLSKYLRLMMQDRPADIPLGEELEHVHSLLSIHQLSSAYRIVYQENVSPGHLRYRVPPISILTFVENSIKHGIQSGRDLELSIRTKLLPSDDGEILNITITDNGGGFPRDLMDRINSLDGYRPEEGHIGIYNVIQRLRYLYQDKAGLMVSGEDCAVIDLFLPGRLE